MCVLREDQCPGLCPAEGQHGAHQQTRGGTISSNGGMRRLGWWAWASTKVLHPLQLSKLQNDVLVQRKHLPEKGRLESELVASQIELKACEEQLRALEAAVECASDPSRLRLLSGTDPTTREIRDRTEKLEVTRLCTHCTR